MIQSEEDQVSAKIRHLPVQELLDPTQAAAYLGLTPGLFKALKLFRCGPPRLMLRSKPFYRRTELEKLRHDWCSAVRVRGEDRLETCRDIDDATGVKATAAPLDPLLRILALRAIRHRIVISIFWTMGIIGGAICLTLY
ncbi:hypothetical protein [Asaia astilbis]|uniref:hypothetical protein n=1 Tax=Asaia astilbis TaxID=610244 RepID=UPI000B0CF89B|nr:hypothetical protein [Asaia astilbis]